MSNHFNKLNDFLVNESFLDWVLLGDGNAEWTLWLQQNPDKSELLHQAKELVLQITVVEKVPEIQLQNAEQRLIKSLQKTPVKTFYKKCLSVAAAVVLLAGSAYVFYNYMQVKVQTTFGETSSKTLPDGSEIVLNANSQVRYARVFNNNDKREVWLSGEAFFHIKQTPAKTRFIVHTNQFDIVVTGTQFNVINTSATSSVALQQGSIILVNDNKDSIYLKPGDFVEYRNQQQIKKEVEADQIAAWKKQQLILDKTPLKDLAEIIKMNYGAEITLDSSLTNETLSGILPNNNLDVLLNAIKEVMDITVVRTGNEITITKKTN